MTLREAIAAAGVETEYLAGDYVSVVTTLNAKTLTKLDHTRRNSTWVMATFTDVVNESGATEADVILGTIQASTLPRVVAAREVMSSEGISLADDQVQTMINVLGVAGNWGQDLIDRVKAFGSKLESYADKSIGRDATVKDMILLRTGELSEEQWKPVNRAYNRRTSHLETVDASSMTDEEFQTWCTALLASEDGNPPE